MKKKGANRGRRKRSSVWRPARGLCYVDRRRSNNSLTAEHEKVGGTKHKVEEENKGKRTDEEGWENMLVLYLVCKSTKHGDGLPQQQQHKYEDDYISHVLKAETRLDIWYHRVGQIEYR